MIKIAILEDQPDEAKRLLDMLRRYGEDHKDFTYTVKHYDRSIQLLEEYESDVDLLLLDIQMPDMLGIDVAKRIRELDNMVMIVFITTMIQYAVEGYSVNAFDYVIKPVRYDGFESKLDRINRMLSHRRSVERIEVRTKEQIRRIPADDILYLEVVNHDILIHTVNDVYRQWGSLKTYEDQLKGSNFVRCNAPYLVNLRYVEGIGVDSVTVRQEELPISRAKRKDFLAAYAQYKGGSR